MMQGSFESESIFYEYISNYVPRPIAWGAFKANADKWFYLSDFVTFDETAGMPDKETFTKIVARIHKRSMGKSPNGKFGFHVPTHLANVPNDNTWQDTWETWYAQALRKMFELEEKTHGQDDELDFLKKQLYEKVIPRLLRPLESGGRQITPCLIHSDLWGGNVKINKQDRQPTFFDSCAFWGHCEVDMGSWRAGRYNMPGYREEYRYGPGQDLMAEPKDAWDDRNLLYSL